MHFLIFARNKSPAQPRILQSDAIFLKKKEHSNVNQLFYVYYLLFQIKKEMIMQFLSTPNLIT